MRRWLREAGGKQVGGSKHVLCCSMCLPSLVRMGGEPRRRVTSSPPSRHPALAPRPCPSRSHTPSGNSAHPCMDDTTAPRGPSAATPARRSQQVSGRERVYGTGFCCPQTVGAATLNCPDTAPVGPPPPPPPPVTHQCPPLPPLPQTCSCPPLLLPGSASPPLLAVSITISCVIRFYAHLLLAV